MIFLVQDAITPLSESEAVDLVKDVFASATERDIYTVRLSYCVRLNKLHTNKQLLF